MIVSSSCGEVKITGSVGRLTVYCHLSLFLASCSKLESEKVISELDNIGGSTRSFLVG